MINKIKIKFLKLFNPIVWGFASFYFNIKHLFSNEAILFSIKKYDITATKVACFVTLSSRVISNANALSIKYLKTLGYHVIVVVNMDKPINLKELISKIERFDDSLSIIVRNNYGYDFGGYKEFIGFINSTKNEVNSIILSNDSTYFPVTNISTFNNFIKLNNHKDVISSSTNYSDAPGKHHQSYFIILNNFIKNKSILGLFFNNYKCLNSRVHAIHNGEVAFSKYLFLKGFTMASFLSIENSVNLYRRFKEVPHGLINSNTTHSMATELITKYEFIFLKKDLARRGILNWHHINDVVSNISNEVAEDILRDFELGYDPKSKSLLDKLISFYGFK